MRILVIGGTGFIGPFVVHDLERRGEMVAVFHRGLSAAPFPVNVRHMIGDRRDLAAHAIELRRFAPDVVIDVILSSRTQAEALMNTFRGVARRVVVVSSIDVYRACGVLHGTEPGPLEPVPLTEDSALRTGPPYPKPVLERLRGVFGWLDDDYVAGSLRFATVSVGWSFTCGITTGGAAYCWGAIPSGDFSISKVSPTPVPVPGGLSFTAISAGAFFACGVATGGAAYCWGANFTGQLGNGSTTASATPVAVAGGLGLKSVSTGAFGYACGITTSNAAFCWGDNLYGELGNGTRTSSATPVAVGGGLSFATLSAGYATACGVTMRGTGYCWGANVIDLGHYQWTSSATPVAVPGG